ncbi:hypothetical protein B5P44_01175 [Mycobacterium sp. CBMA 213]|uniref:Uncharacterized protein n=1 Tax=Mycolicibacterium sp. CBMA 213 TaxID=1968788 RepID=A0A343VRM8_9MYCO|nr:MULTISPECIES: hypothetical protein [unclassified Mycolicibacterium]AVN58552.1 hypothetical protein B5P44_p00257 [Mycolicibacterium sp. CBMA 213]MUL61194.1 hypothetical protein [Mycolicibacterium sp. CBMA 335]MUM03432.1 hypothetical protein [Mycolicibacterium sp. CBMA 213]
MAVTAFANDNDIIDQHVAGVLDGHHDLLGDETGRAVCQCGEALEPAVADEPGAVVRAHTLHQAAVLRHGMKLEVQWTRTVAEVFPCGVHPSKSSVEARNANLDEMYPDMRGRRGVALSFVTPWTKWEDQS